MIEAADAPMIRTPRVTIARFAPGPDRAWLAAMLAITVVELLWWAVAWEAGTAPALFLGTYLLLAFAGVAAAIGLRLALRLAPISAPWREIVAGTILIGIGASAFLPLKYAIPREMPFWLDQPIARAEQAVFGAQPWLLLDHGLGWAAVPMDGLYASWLPVQTLVLFLVLLARPSPAKSRALIAYSLAWFVLGVAAAMLLSSAGPLFYDRLLGGTTFASLRATLQARGAWVALAESDRMWASLADNRPGLVAGISAVPSIHVAISLWIVLAARSLAPRAAAPALIYAMLICIGSVQLGWHYVSDGLAGIVGMLAIWRLTPALGLRTPMRLRSVFTAPTS